MRSLPATWTVPATAIARVILTTASTAVFTVVFFFAFTVFAATEESELDFPTPTLKTTIKKSRPSIMNEPSGFSLVIPSVVVHGIRPDDSLSSEIVRKVDSRGQTVVTPGVGLQYEKDGYLAIAAGFKDCYDNLAGTFQLGQSFQVSDRTSWGYTVGVYMRETPISCQTVTTISPGVGGGPGRSGAMGSVTTSQECSEFDSYPFKFLTTINNTSVDIIPMPFLHFSTAIYKSRDFQLDFKIMTNYALNEFGFGIPF